MQEDDHIIMVDPEDVQVETLCDEEESMYEVGNEEQKVLINRVVTEEEPMEQTEGENPKELKKGMVAEASTSTEGGTTSQNQVKRNSLKDSSIDRSSEGTVGSFYTLYTVVLRKTSVFE